MTQEEEYLDHELKFLWPYDWPGRQFVDLDTTGDPGAWLDEVLVESPSETLFGASVTEGAWDNQASFMAEEYLAELQNRGFDPPSAYDEEGEATDDLALFQAEFITFLHHWRDVARGTWEAK